MQRYININVTYILWFSDYGSSFKYHYGFLTLVAWYYDILYPSMLPMDKFIIYSRNFIKFCVQCIIFNEWYVYVVDIHYKSLHFVTRDSLFTWYLPLI